MHESSPFFRKLHTRFAAGICLAVKSLSYFGWATEVADGKNGDLKLTALFCDLETVAHFDVTGRFDWLAIALDSAEFTSSRGESASLEEARGP